MGTTDLEIYTDGGHKGAWGTWAFVMVCDGQIIREGSGRVTNTTGNHMEFQAVIEALKSLPEPTSAQVFSDSRIVIDAVTLNQCPKPYVHLYERILDLTTTHFLGWKWVRSHAGVIYNERCDELCILARQIM